MNDIESAHIEARIATCRSEIKAAGRAGNAVLARAYAEELLHLLKRRSPAKAREEEEKKGIL